MKNNQWSKTIATSAIALSASFTSVHAEELQCGTCVALDFGNFSEIAAAPELRLEAIEYPTATPENRTTLDVLIAYTDAALAYAGSSEAIEAVAKSSASYLNRVYENSDAYVSIRILDVFPAGPYGQEGGVLSAVANGNDGFMDDVPVARETIGADMVVLFCVAPEMPSTLGGVAYTSPDSSRKYAAVRLDIANVNRTFAHEVGHLHGSFHARDQSGGGLPDTYNYGYRICGSFSTVMAYSCGGPSLDYFSNPNISYGDTPIGIDPDLDPANGAWVSRVINESSFRIADFYSATELLRPKDLLFSNLRGDRVDLEWTYQAVTSSRYDIEVYNLSAEAWQPFASVDSTDEFFTVTGLEEETTYRFRIALLTDGLVEAYSEELEITTPKQVLEANITSYLDGDQISSFEEVIVRVDATTPAAEGIDRVALRVNGALISADREAPYEWNLGTLSPGTHQLRAIAFDADGNSVADVIDIEVIAPLYHREAEDASFTNGGIEVTEGTVTYLKQADIDPFYLLFSMLPLTSVDTNLLLRVRSIDGSERSLRVIVSNGIESGITLTSSSPEWHTISVPVNFPALRDPYTYMSIRSVNDSASLEIDYIEFFLNETVVPVDPTLSSSAELNALNELIVTSIAEDDSEIERVVLNILPEGGSWLRFGPGTPTGAEGEYSWNAGNLPNGDYLIRTRVFTADGGDAIYDFDLTIAGEAAPTEPTLETSAALNASNELVVTALAEDDSGIDRVVLWIRPIGGLWSAQGPGTLSGDGSFTWNLGSFPANTYQIRTKVFAEDTGGIDQTIWFTIE